MVGLRWMALLHCRTINTNCAAGMLPRSLLFRTYASTIGTAMKRFFYHHTALERKNINNLNEWSSLFSESIILRCIHHCCILNQPGLPCSSQGHSRAHTSTRWVERTYVGCKEGKTCIASTCRQKHANTSLGTVRYHRRERAHRGVSSRLTVLQPSVGGRLVSYTSQYICYNCIIHYNIIKLYKYYNMDGMLWWKKT